jgi:fumarylacetoacetate (FAA) hydrolase family protein
LEKEMRERLTADLVLPHDHEGATLIGRAWLPERGGPAPMMVLNKDVFDLSGVARTVSQLLEPESPAAVIRAALPLPRIGALQALLENADPDARDRSQPWLLAPCDLQALRASATSEGGAATGLLPRSQPLSAVGCGVEVGIHPPLAASRTEPELVLAINSRGRVVGATLGNHIAPRNASGSAMGANACCAVGPFIRLFDSAYTVDDVLDCEILLRIDGGNVFVLHGGSPMPDIGADPADIVARATGSAYRNPDGLMLSLRTAFAPTAERLKAGHGFSHKVGDIVVVHTPRLGALVNRINHADRTEPWTFGIAALIRYLAHTRS